jgi:hypothetical protein
MHVDTEGSSKPHPMLNSIKGAKKASTSLIPTPPTPRAAENMSDKGAKAGSTGEGLLADTTPQSYLLEALCGKITRSLLNRTLTCGGCALCRISHLF